MQTSVAPRVALAQGTSNAVERRIVALTARAESVANLLKNSTGNLWASVERLSGHAEECAEDGGPRNRREGELGALEEALDRAHSEAERVSALVGPLARI